MIDPRLTTRNRIRAEGRADAEPVAPNDTPANRAQQPPRRWSRCCCRRRTATRSSTRPSPAPAPAAPPKK